MGTFWGAMLGAAIGGSAGWTLMYRMAAGHWPWKHER